MASEAGELAEYGGGEASEREREREREKERESFSMGKRPTAYSTSVCKRSLPLSRNGRERKRERFTDPQ